MLGKKQYANNQKTYELVGNTLTYFFKNGNLKAKGRFENEQMQGEWKFYRETGQLWQVGNFKNNIKNGPWVRYNKNDSIEYNKVFEDGKVVKKTTE